jgi:hypothetical protein
MISGDNNEGAEEKSLHRFWGKKETKEIWEKVASPKRRSYDARGQREECRESAFGSAHSGRSGTAYKHCLHILAVRNIS